MTAYIGYKNIFDLNPSLSTTTELPDYPASNAFGLTLHDRWMPGVTGTAWLYAYLPTIETVDYVAIYGHNIEGKAVSIYEKVGITFQLIHSFVAGANTIFERFTPTADTQFAISIADTTPGTYITAIALGSAIELNPLRTPFAPPPKAASVEIVNNVSVENIPLGRVTRTVPFPLRIGQTIVSESWIEANSESLIDGVNKRPFFFVWDDTKDDVCFCWTDEAVDPPKYNRYGYLDFTIKAWGLR